MLRINRNIKIEPVLEIRPEQITSFSYDTNFNGPVFTITAIVPVEDYMRIADSMKTML